jgi:hypothetical protein
MRLIEPFENFYADWKHQDRVIRGHARNLRSLLDAAAARRFLFKVRFLPMTADQIAKAFRGAFGADPPGFVLKLAA